MEGQQMWMPDSGNAISILFLRYLRFLLFNPKPINQQKETEKGKQKTEIEGGKAGVEQERTEGTEKGRPTHLQSRSKSKSQG